MTQLTEQQPPFFTRCMAQERWSIIHSRYFQNKGKAFKISGHLGTNHRRMNDIIQGNDSNGCGATIQLAASKSQTDSEWLRRKK